MNKRYITNRYTSKNLEKRHNIIKKMIKLKDKDALKALSIYFSAELKGKIVQNMIKSYRKIELIRKTDFFKHHTVQFWKKKSGFDYTDGLKTSKKLLRTDKEPIEQILLELLKVTGFNGKLKTSMPFVLNDYQYKFLLQCPKEILGEHIIKTPSNKLIIRHLLQGTFKNETYLFFSDTMVDENHPSVSVGLNLLVNGLPNGVKPLMRYDNCGFFPMEFLKKNNIPYSLNERTKGILEKGFSHTNALSKHVKDHAFKEEETSQLEHMHKSTYYQDMAFAAAHYFKTNLSLRNKINSSHTSTISTDLYNEITQNYKQKQDMMVNDAHMLKGMVPIQRIIQFTTNEFNFKLNTLSQPFFKFVNQVRSHDSNITYPTAQELLSNNEFIVPSNIVRITQEQMEQHEIGKRFLAEENKNKEEESELQLQPKVNN